MREHMTYLRRKIDNYLREWKQNPDRKPLVVKGLRQVGKTESIRRFGEANYAHVVEVLINSDKYEDIRYGIKFTGGNIGYDNKIYTFPYFPAFLLKRYLAGRNLV